jgi:hypothetical protein
MGLQMRQEATVTTAVQSSPEQDQTTAPTPDGIMELGHAFWGSRALLSAVELDLFSALAGGSALDAEGLGERLGIQPRGARDFFDALVALGVVEREEGVYRNTPAAELFLDRSKPSYVGGVLEIAAMRLWSLWGSLTEALRTGQPQNEIKRGGNLFEAIYSDPEKLRGFLRAMTGVSAGAARALAFAFPWERHRTVIDVGGAEGSVPVQLALAHEHLRGGVFELPEVGPFVQEFVAAAALSDRLRFYPGDFFVDELPSADVLIMGHILHDWSLEERRLLCEKAYAALPEGGALIVYDAIIDDDRRENALALLMSLLMLLETPAGANHTGAECQQWLRDAGFRETYVRRLAGPDSMVVGIK